jgi:hypothetical protein
MEQTTFEYSLIAISESISFQMKLPEKNQDLAFHFKLAMATEIDFENQTARIENPIQNSSELRQKVDMVVEHYKKQFPQIHRLSKYFKKELGENEFFFLVPTTIIPIEQRLLYSNYLKAANEGKDFETLKTQFNDIFENIIGSYVMIGYNDKSVARIGERDKAKRKCRFCGKGQPEVSFKKIAHSISEALGNKKIISNEECDSCNKKFGTQLEPDLIAYLDLYRSYFRVQGKNGPPKIKGKNFEFHATDTEVKIKYFGDDDGNQMTDFGRTYKFDTNKEITEQNIYRTLCKFFIGVIDPQYLPRFTNTIEWINGERKIPFLPKVAIMYSYHFFKTTHPQICVYLRKVNNKSLPFAVGEFHFTFLTFVFVIPIELEDEKKFLTADEYDTFWKFFKHYSLNKDWRFENFSDDSRKNLVLNVNFNVAGGTLK